MVTKQEFWGGIEYINEDGKLHRLDGPAVEWKYGNKSWYINGMLHREDGPARESITGNKCWYINGLLHREDGPAIELSDGEKNWYLNDIEYTEEEYEKELIKIKLERLKNNYGN
jgi:hypothetical protein